MYSLWYFINWPKSVESPVRWFKMKKEKKKQKNCLSWPRVHIGLPQFYPNHFETLNLRSLHILHIYFVFFLLPFYLIFFNSISGHISISRILIYKIGIGLVFVWLLGTYIWNENEGKIKPEYHEEMNKINKKHSRLINRSLSEYSWANFSWW